MTHFNDTPDMAAILDDDFFEDFDFFDKSKRIANKRTAVRYVRHDIVVTVIDNNFFQLTLSKKELPMNVVNINGRGVLLRGKYKFALNKILLLNLRFNSGKAFKMKGKVVNKSLVNGEYYYGVKFSLYQNELSEYLLETQQTLIIK